MFGFNFFFSRAGTKTIVDATDTSEKKMFLLFFWKCMNRREARNMWFLNRRDARKKVINEVVTTAFPVLTYPSTIEKQKKKVDKIFLCC